MFFTKLGRFIAWLMVVLGGFRAGLGFQIAFTVDQAAAQRYLGSGGTGQAIDHGLLWVLGGVALGVLVEISLSVAARKTLADSIK